MVQNTPPLFRQGISPRIRFYFFVLVSVVLMLVDGRLRSLEKFRSSMLHFTTPMVQMARMPFELLQETEGYFVSKVRLKHDNDLLTDENTHLRLTLARFEELQAENRALREQLHALESLHGQTITAEVIRRIPDPFTRRVSINAGEAQGVKAGMPVLGPHGVVGQINRTSKRQSEVTLLTDHRQQMAVMNARTDQLYVVQGTGKPFLDCRFVLPENDIKVGDSLVTSGLDPLFPKNIMVGTVAAVSYQPGEMYKTVLVKPTEDPNQTRFTSVILVDPELVKEEMQPQDNAPNQRRRRRS